MIKWDMWKFECQLYSKQPAFRQKLKFAQSMVGKFLSGNKAYVAFSGGKDSTVVLDLARHKDKNILAVFGDDEWILPETARIIKKTSNVLKVKSSGKHTEWFESYKDSGVKDIPKYMKKLGYNACLLGLRADENAYRKKYLKLYGLVYASKRQKQCNPLAWWTVRDIWAYIFSKGIAYNNAYKILTQLNVEFHRQRIGPFANEKVLQYGQLSILRRGWPALFAKFADKYPEARNYI